MTQRTWAAALAVPLFVALGVVLALTGLPFVTYAPGPSINVLGDNGDKPIIGVQGHRVYRDDGQLRMTTVSVTERNARLDVFTLMKTWFSQVDAVYPFSAQYPSTGSQKQDTREGQVEMRTSQDSAVVAALTQLGYDLHPRLKIAAVTPGMPADGKIEPGDVLLRVGGTRVTATTDVSKLIAAVPDGGSIPVVVKRDGERVKVRRHTGREGRQPAGRRHPGAALPLPGQGQRQPLRSDRRAERGPDVRPLHLRRAHAGLPDRRQRRGRYRHHRPPGHGR